MLASFLQKNKWNLLIQLIFWLVVYWAWFRIAGFRFSSTPELEKNIFWIIFASVNIHNWVLFPYLYQRQHIKSYFGATFFLALLTTGIEYSLVIDTILGYLNDEDQIPKYIRATQISVFSSTFIRTFVFMLICSLYYLYRDSIKWQHLQSQEMTYLKKYEQMENEMRYYFCHEHFTQNALSILAYRFPDNPKKTKELLTQLFHIYQYSFSKTAKSFVKAEEELNFAKALLAYYKTIFPEVRVVMEVKGDIPTLSVPPLITESIIGNAFKHGMNDGSGEIEILFDFTKPRTFYFSCRNKYDVNAVGVENPNARGLEFVKKRLALLYRDEACLSWRIEHLNAYFTICMHFPI